MFFKPDNFEGKPYGYVTNQISHGFMVGGVIFVYAVVLVVFALTGEFPPKWAIIAGAAVAYAAFELAVQGWRGLDTVEDWWFVVVYGVAGPVYSFTELQPGLAQAVFNLLDALPFISMLSLHLLIGAVSRTIK